MLGKKSSVNLGLAAAKKRFARGVEKTDWLVGGLLGSRARPPRPVAPARVSRIFFESNGKRTRVPDAAFLLSNGFPLSFVQEAIGQLTGSKQAMEAQAIVKELSKQRLLERALREHSLLRKLTLGDIDESLVKKWREKIKRNPKLEQLLWQIVRLNALVPSAISITKLAKTRGVELGLERVFVEGGKKVAYSASYRNGSLCFSRKQMS